MAKKNQDSIAIGWGFEDDEGILQSFTESKRPRKVGKLYTSVWPALGYKAVKVVVVRVKTFDALLKKNRSTSKPGTEQK